MKLLSGLGRFLRGWRSIFYWGLSSAPVRGRVAPRGGLFRPQPQCPLCGYAAVAGCAACGGLLLRDAKRVERLQSFVTRRALADAELERFIEHLDFASSGARGRFRRRFLGLVMDDIRLLMASRTAVFWALLVAFAALVGVLLAVRLVSLS